MWSRKTTLLIVVLYVALGLLNALPSSKLEIAGGHVVHPSEAHYVVFVSSSLGNCTGQLISPHWVLTAGHCAKGASKIIIYLGAQKKPDLSRAKRLYAVRILVHHKYTPHPNLTNDLALIELSQRVRETSTISIVKLPSKNQANVKYTDLTAYGWGQIGENRDSYVLRTVSLKVAPCDNRNDKSMICTSRAEGKSVCRGDSGGPLVRADDVLIGITSKGMCGYHPREVSMFTRVDYYLDWIKQFSDAIIPN